MKGQLYFDLGGMRLSILQSAALDIVIVIKTTVLPQHPCDLSIATHLTMTLYLQYEYDSRTLVRPGNEDLARKRSNGQVDRRSAQL
jgi:hypothetical protein